MHNDCKGIYHIIAGLGQNRNALSCFGISETPISPDITMATSQGRKENVQNWEEAHLPLLYYTGKDEQGGGSDENGLTVEFSLE